MKRNFIIITNGTMTSITPRTKKAALWIGDCISYQPWQLIGNTLFVDSRMGQDIIEAIFEQF